jgi:hypothetical protein
VTVKSREGEKVQFPTPPEPEKVKSQPPKPLESLGNTIAKVVDTKERKDKEEPQREKTKRNRRFLSLATTALTRLRMGRSARR